MSMPSVRNEMEGTVFIGMPSRGLVAVDLLVAYAELIKPKHYFVSTNIVPLDAARNSLVADFLVKTPEATHLLFWDDDIVPPKDALLKLWRHQEPIVSGLYFKKAPPYEPVMGIYTETPTEKGFTTFLDWEDGKSYYVDAVGMGFCLIRRDVFQEIPFPPFKFGEFSEDYEFCLLCRKHGFRIKVDTSVKLIHLADRVPITEDFYRMYKEKTILRSLTI